MTTEDEKKKELKSQATRINNLFKKQKSIIGTQQSIATFKEPVLILMRNNMKSEFYENATIGKFEYTHSNGEEMYITLDQHFQYTFDYAGRNFRGYICHENYPFPLPHDPLITAELKKISDEKILNDYRKWLAEEWKAKGDLWWKVLGGIAICIGAYALFRLLVPSNPAVAEAAANATKEIVNTTVQNITVFP